MGFNSLYGKAVGCRPGGWGGTLLRSYIHIHAYTIKSTS